MQVGFILFAEEQKVVRSKLEVTRWGPRSNRLAR
jgi:hypothetical protein